MIQFSDAHSTDRAVVSLWRPVGLTFRTDAPVLRVAFVAQQMIGAAEVQIVQWPPDARVAHRFGVRPEDEHDDQLVEQGNQAFDDAVSEIVWLEFVSIRIGFRS